MRYTHILIISSNSNMSHSLNCPKNWTKGPKRLKILSTSHTFEHSYLPTSITKQNKNHCVRNYKIYCHNFYKTLHDFCLGLPKSFRRRTQTAKNTKIWSSQKRSKIIWYRIIKHTVLIFIKFVPNGFYFALWLESAGRKAQTYEIWSFLSIFNNCIQFSQDYRQIQG